PIQKTSFTRAGRASPSKDSRGVPGVAPPSMPVAQAFSSGVLPMRNSPGSSLTSPREIPSPKSTRCVSGSAAARATAVKTKAKAEDVALMVCVYRLFADRLRNAQVGEEVADLLLVEPFQQALGHQASPHGLDRVDFIDRQGQVLPVEAAQDGDLIVAIHLEAAEGATVLGLHGDELVAFADLGVGVDDADEHGAEV